ncbi:MAG: sporulation integral membrane protein YlbJ [Clostridium sp.]|uniref:sporulation integral membrane protein YlbJ n=1 Tax=Clostridium sp. TaxID=1506 RepID=UPI003F2FC5BA
MISIFVLAILIFFLLCYLLKRFKVNNTFLICFFITIFSILFFLDINTSLQGIKNGFYLCFNSIIPSIFSFSVICNLLISYDGISIYAKLLGPLICKPLRLSLNCSFILISSFLCGYPLGAKYATEAYNSNSISKEEYFRVLNLASNASPIFIIGVLGSSMLGNIQLGYILLLSSFLSILFLSFFIKPSKTDYPKAFIYTNHTPPKFGFALQSAIENGIKTTLNVCGYVVLFSLVLSILKNLTLFSSLFFTLEELLSLPKNLLYGIFLGSFEITNGCNLISSINLSIHLKLSILSFFICFGGMSIFCQTASFFNEIVSIKKYFFFKFIQGILGFLITFILSSTFLTYTTASQGLYKTPSISLYVLFSSLILILIFIISKLKKMLGS